MPSFVVHAVVPLLFLLALPHLDRRRVWILWPLTLVPDLDYFFGLHRALTSNVFVLLPFAIALAVAWRRDDAALRQWMTIALVYLASHLVMDTFVGGTVLLYPLSTHTFCYAATIVVHTPTNTPRFAWEDCSRPGIPGVITDYAFVSETDSAMLAFLVPAGLAVALWNLRAYLHHPPR